MKLAYTFNEGLAQIGETRTGGYKAVAAGELKTYKSGRRRMVTHQALMEYVALKQKQSEGSRRAA